MGEFILVDRILFGGIVIKIFRSLTNKQDHPAAHETRSNLQISRRNQISYPMTAVGTEPPLSDEI
jgi:hypothetical protein